MKLFKQIKNKNYLRARCGLLDVYKGNGKIKIKLALFLAAMLFSLNAYSCGDHPVVYVKKKSGVKIGLFITPNDTAVPLT